MKTLYICEKPSQARDIALVLGATKRGDGYIKGDEVVLTWCFGHLLELAPPDHYCKDIKPWRRDILPIVPEQWVKLPKQSTKRQLNVIKGLLKNTECVVIATDADREGDVIGREVLDYFHYKGPIQRLWLSALDPQSIQNALNDLKPDAFSKRLYAAGEVRQHADWLVGMNLTMAATIKQPQGTKGVLSVGRVQTPTLKLVVDRDRDIENFQPKDYFTLQMQWHTNQGEQIPTHWLVPDEWMDEAGLCLNKQQVESVSRAMEGQTGVVDIFKSENKRTEAPLCLSLSALQSLASSQLSLGAKETLDIAQTLYEKYKATTYPRSDCQYLPMSQHGEAAEILQTLQTIDSDLEPLIAQCNPLAISRVWNDKKITAHHAIIPTTNNHVNLSQFSDKERQLYRLICGHYLAQFLGDYEYTSKQILIQLDEHRFKGNSQTPKQMGWKQAIKDTKADEAEPTGCIPDCQMGDPVRHHDNTVASKKTKPVARFTEGTLIKAMASIGKWVDDPAMKQVLKETAGIGTEATRANIIETLLKREYLMKKGKVLQSSKKGRLLVEQLPDLVTSPYMTALWEQQLGHIAEGSMEPCDFMEGQHEALRSILDSL